jgi:hypothetical protein
LEPLDWSHWKEAILQDLVRVPPDIRQWVSRIDIMRFGHAMARLKPGAIFSEKRSKLARLDGQLLFANSDLSGFSIFEEAQYRGVRAAGRALTLLSARSSEIKPGTPTVSSISQRKGDDGATRRTASVLKLLQKHRLHIVGIYFHLTVRDLLVGGSLKAELANAQPVFGTHRWSERTTGDGARGIEFTGACRWVKDRTGLVVAEIRELLLGVFILGEHSCFQIPRERGREADDGFTRAFSNGVGALRVVNPQFVQAVLQPDGIELAYGKNTHATPRAARTTCKPRTASSVRVGECRIHDLNQGWISGWQGRLPHK